MSAPLEAFIKNATAVKQDPDPLEISIDEHHVEAALGTSTSVVSHGESGAILCKIELDSKQCAALDAEGSFLQPSGAQDQSLDDLFPPDVMDFFPQDHDYYSAQSSSMAQEGAPEAAADDFPILSRRLRQKKPSKVGQRFKIEIDEHSDGNSNLQLAQKILERLTNRSEPKENEFSPLTEHDYCRERGKPVTDPGGVNDDYEVSYFSYDNLSKVCRICLGSEQVTESLVDSPLFTFYTDLTMLEVDENDKLPKNICHTCFQELFRTVSFIQKCKKNDAFLKLVEKELEKLHKMAEAGKLQQQTGSEEHLEPNFLAAGGSIDDFVELTTDETSEGLQFDAEGNKVATAAKAKPKRKRKSAARAMPSLCRTCGKMVTGIMSHYKESRQCRPRNFKCKLCPRAFTGASSLETHSRSHSKVTPYSCSVCDKKFRFAQNLKRHLIVHTYGKRFKCDYCDKAFSTAMVRDEHINIHTGATPFECKFNCGLSFKNRSQRYHHGKTYHDRNRSFGGSAEDQSGEPYLCPVCNEVQKNAVRLRVHLRKVHNKKDSFLCSVCGKRLNSRVNLKLHMGTHMEVKPFECQYCQKRFAHRSSVKLHHKMHTGERPFVCPHCPRSFTQGPHLKVHVLTHTGEKPEVCPICLMAFAQRTNLRVHLRHHTGEKPFVCHVCFKAFYDQSSRKRHVRVTHGDDEIENIGPKFLMDDSVLVNNTEESVEAVTVEENFQAFF